AVAVARAQETATAAGRAEQEALAALPPAWLADAAALTADRLRGLDAERERLAGAEPRWEALKQARAGRDALRQRPLDLQAQLAQFPDEERCHPDEAARDLTAARQR